MKHNQDHEINWEKIIFLDKEDHWKGRKLKEALYINALNPSTTTNASKIMNLEKGFELDPIWNEFNSIFRSYIREKVERELCWDFCFILIVMSIVLLLTMPGSYMRVRVDSLYLHACISCVRVNDET